MQTACTDQRARADQDAQADQRAPAATRHDLPGRRMIDMKARLRHGHGGLVGPEDLDTKKHPKPNAAGNKNLVETW